MEHDSRPNAVTRRRFLAAIATVTGGAALAACAPSTPATTPAKSAGQSGASAPAETPSAPAVAKTKQLRILRQNSFVDPENKFFSEYMQKNWGDANKVEIIAENVGFTDLQPKTSVALESGQGPDVIVMQWNWAHLYAPKLLDVSDLAQEMEKKGGGFYDIFIADCKVDGAWRTVPFGVLGNAMVYREDILKEMGESQYPETWEQIAKLGKRVKEKKGMPVGQAWGHSWADPPTMVYPLLWSFGGQEVQKDGKTVAINSPGTLAAVEFATDWFKGSMEADMLGWDDSSNNQAYPAGRIWTTLNGSSIYFSAKKDNPDLAKKSNHAPHFKGPKGRFYVAGPFSFAIPTYVKDKELAKEFVRQVTDPKTSAVHLSMGEGYTTSAVKYHEKDPTWDKDPKMALYKDASDYKWPGYPGNPTRAASEALSKYIVLDMFAKALAGTKPKDAVDWAEKELQKIYGA